MPKDTRRPLFIKQWREHRGRERGKKFSQEELADESGMSPGNLSLLERGKIPYIQDSLERVAGALGVETEDLFRDPTDPVGGLYDLIRKAKPGQRRQLAEITRTILKVDVD